MPQKILDEDWSDYDNKKIKVADKPFFACSEEWEVDYLIKKIRKVYPMYTESQIKAAIRACCASLNIPTNKPRAQFVKCVMDRLRN